MDRLLKDPDTGDRYPDHDRVRLSIRSDHLDHEIWIPFLPPSELTVDRVFFAIENVLQSKKEWFFETPFTLYFVHAPLPHGGGKMDVASDWFMEKKKCVIRIPDVPLNLCAAAAIVACRRRLERKSQPYRGKKALTKGAIDLHNAAGIKVGVECGPSEWDKFQNVLPKDIELVVISRDHLNQIVYRGERKVEKKIVIYHAKRHYYPVRSLTAFYGVKKVCYKCLKGYQRYHRCKGGCPLCNHPEPCPALTPRWCSSCNVTYPSYGCFDRHVPVCGELSRCTTCGYTVKRGNNHVCNASYCSLCQKMQEEGHHCFMPVRNSEDLNPKQRYIFFDFETMLRPDNSHQPNLCVAHVVCGNCMTKPMEEEMDCECRRHRRVFEGEDTLQKFVGWILREKKVIALAHNGRAFDMHLVLDQVHREGIKPSTIIQTGCKIMKLKVQDVLFLDSLNFLPMALSKLPKAFGLKELCKGFFAHGYNRLEHQGHVLNHLPARECYDPDSMSPEGRQAFDEWYERHKHDKFDLQHELRQYCRSDVDILQRACGEFRKLFVETTGIDPFASATTIASACNVVYRTLFLKEGQIPVILPKPSNQSAIALAWMSKRSKELGVEIIHGRNGGEVRVLGRPVDGFVAPDRVFEFMGCFYHSCPVCYKDRDALHPRRKVPHREVYRASMERVGTLMRSGYSVEVQWECQFKRMVQAEELKRLREPFIGAEPLNPRSALYGGRTEVYRLYHEAQAPGESIRYEDVMSLYPHVCKRGIFPVSIPTVYHGDDIPEKVFGIMTCKVLPPRQLYLPVLPARIGGKLLFALCRTCAEERRQESCPHEKREDRAIVGSWVTLELEKAVDMGYIILEKYEAWHYAEKEQLDSKTGEGGLWVQYINKFLKIKVQASGYPEHVQTDLEKEQYIRGYKEHEGIDLDPDKIQYNPGLRALSKLCLNSFWVSTPGTPGTSWSLCPPFVPPLCTLY